MHQKLDPKSLVFRKTTLRVLNDEEMSWVGGASLDPEFEINQPPPPPGKSGDPTIVFIPVSNVYTAIQTAK